MLENLCCGGPFAAVSRDRRYTRRSSFWSISSPFYFILQPLCGSAHWNKRRSPGQSATRQVGSVIFKPSFLRSFQPPCSFLPSSVHALSQILNTPKLKDFHQILSQNMHLRILILSKYSIK
ncbi:hypothetical protein H5410_052874 [Solanum commersonii]|uniref:Uncharacterized protein n=1 Tax=Solanum commersonii TaxID=4109 RepID=A0A9J5X3E8_SOLCO|nr:hypothetical protein H5410_052874 [Solanum commersonii]